MGCGAISEPFQLLIKLLPILLILSRSISNLRSKNLDYYQTHLNISSDPAYQEFAAQLALPILDKLVPNSSALDFGCGPDSALSTILRQHGHNMTLYEPFFFPAKKSLKKTYDFIVCSEAAEHFHQPAKEFK